MSPESDFEGKKRKEVEGEEEGRGGSDLPESEGSIGSVGTDRRRDQSATASRFLLFFLFNNILKNPAHLSKSELKKGFIKKIMKLIIGRLIL